MSIISGVIVDWTVSPRVITIPVTETNVTIEDLQDTLLDLEDSEAGIIWPYLRETSGGEVLGGGVSVGWTMELQNAQLAFIARTTPLENGTVTTGGTKTLIDLSATFQTNNVGRGDLIINVTDSSQCTVISVDSETQLTTTILTGGTSNDFVISDVYDVYDVVQCSIEGGNLVAVDDVESELDPVFPTFGTQIVRTSASSATTANQEALEYGTFNGAVHINVFSGISGTDGLKGNEANPVDNFVDAELIAIERGFSTFHFMSDYTFGATDVLDYYSYVGLGPSITQFIFTSGCTTRDTTFENAELSGDLSGAIFCTNCHINALSGIGCTTADTVFERCLFKSGIVQIRSDNIRYIRMNDCSSGIAGGIASVLDVNGTTGDITLLKFVGGRKLINITSSVNIKFITTGGELTIDSSCTAGTIRVYGDTEIDDNSGVGCTIIDDTTPALTWRKSVSDVVAGSFGEIIANMIKYNSNRSKIDDTAYTLTIYDDDNVTPIKVFDLKDSDGVASVTSIFERIPQ